MRGAAVAAGRTEPRIKLIGCAIRSPPNIPLPNTTINLALFVTKEKTNKRKAMRWQELQVVRGFE